MTQPAKLKKGERRRGEILRAASLLFREKGYRGTTLQDITERVNCSKGSVYHHFESKLHIMKALCEDMSLRAFQRYQELALPDGLKKLDRLLYHAYPFRTGEESFLAARISLMMQEEGAVLSQHVRDTNQRVFLAELQRLLQSLRDQGICHYSQSALPELAWDSHAVFGEAMLQEAVRLLRSGATPASRAAQLLATQRFLWERLFDLPFDGLSIVPLEELLAVMGSACKLVSLQETQLRFD